MGKGKVGEDAAKAEGARAKKMSVANYQLQDNYACCAAALSASRRGIAHAPLLEKAAAEEFGPWLRKICKEYPWVDMHAGKGGCIVWTLEECITARVHNGGLFKRWSSTLKPYFINSLNSWYVDFHVWNPDKGVMVMPSGTSKEDILNHVLHKAWEAAHKPGSCDVPVEVADGSIGDVGLSAEDQAAEGLAGLSSLPGSNPHQDWFATVHKVSRFSN